MVTTLKARREEAGLTAAGVAQSASVPLDTVRAIEGAKVLGPSFLTVAAIGRVIGVSLDELAEVAWEDD